MKKYNFNPGPSILSDYAVNNTAEAIKNLEGSGLSLLEISHRGSEFTKIMEETKALFKELLGIPDGYSVLFLGGGASMQFCMIPYNFLRTKAAYTDTGTWASKAIQEAKLFGEVNVLASSKDKNYSFIPKNYVVPSDVDYFHVTTNNTIYGTELKEDLTVSVPLIAEASSDIFSRPMDVSKYACIYGGAQKNLGPAGVAFVILKNSMLENVAERSIPSMISYKVHVENDSLYNTPPVVNIFTCLQTLKWYKETGMQKIYKMNVDKANILYDEIDRNKLFKCPVAEEDRSIMNVCFVMHDHYKDKEQGFLDMAKAKGLINLKGHRSVGGFRASIYNAMPIEGVKALVNAMQEYEKSI